MSESTALTAFLDQDRRRMSEQIRRYGCSITYVSDDVACACCQALGRAERRKRKIPSSVAFAYTTGLHGVGHPELIVHALAPAQASLLLNSLTQRVLDCCDLTPGERLDLGEMRMVVENLGSPERYLGQANRFYGRPPEASVPGLQLTWADPQGRFPWNQGCAGLARRQPRQDRRPRR